MSTSGARSRYVWRACSSVHSLLRKLGSKTTCAPASCAACMACFVAARQPAPSAGVIPVTRKKRTPRRMAGQSNSSGRRRAKAAVGPVVEHPRGTWGAALFQEVGAAAGVGIAVPDDQIGADTLFARLVADEPPQRVGRQTRHPGRAQAGVQAQADEAHGRVQLGTTRLHLQRGGDLQPPMAGRGETNHGLAKTDQVEGSGRRAGHLCPICPGRKCTGRSTP